MRLGLVLFCFLVSGAAALIYEVLWFRHLALLFGVSSYALTTVLVAYMAGLGLGAAAVGGWSSRIRHPLLVYACIELAIGLYAAWSPRGFALIQPVYVHFYQASGGPFAGQIPLLFVLTLLVLLLPTVLMGATLPLLVSAVRQPSAVRVIGTLYFINTLGGVAGAALAGYFLILHLGMTGSLWLAVNLNWLAAGGAFLLGWIDRKDRSTPLLEKGAPAFVRPAAGQWTILAAIGLSGFTAMVYEVVWTRLVSLLVGSSTYAFTTILTVFLSGIALGSLSMTGRAERTKRPARLLAVSQGIIALFVWASCPLLDQGHALILYASLFSGNEFWMFQLAEFLMAAAVMWVPTFLLGAAFPLASRLYLGHGMSASRSAGDLYAANTLGAIAGVLAGGFLFLGNPNIGAQKALVIGGAVNLIVAGGVLNADPRLRGAARVSLWLAIGLASVLAYTRLPAWHQQLLTSGIYNRVEFLKKQIHRHNVEALLHHQPLEPLGMASLRREIETERLILFAEGRDATVTVTEQPAEGEKPRKYLRINGKCEATSSFWQDLPAQVFAAQFGMCSHPHPERVAIIGLGSGVSLGSILTHPEVRQVDCLEISPSVVQAARLFAEENLHALDDPRMRLILNDGRNHFMATDRTYDLIISEPTNPWVTGVSNLFTREHFRNCRKRLAPQGRVCQWFHLYSTTPELLRIHFRTFLEVFPHAALWVCRQDIFLVGSPEPWSLDRRVVGAHLAEPAVRSDLDRIQVGSRDDFMGYFLLGKDALRAYAGDGPLNTDDHPIIEFRAPMVIYNGFPPEDLLNTLKARQQ